MRNLSGILAATVCLLALCAESPGQVKNQNVENVLINHGFDNYTNRQLHSTSSDVTEPSTFLGVLLLVGALGTSYFCKISAASRKSWFIQSMDDFQPTHPAQSGRTAYRF